MSTDTAKLRSKLAKLNKSLDELESQLEPLFSESLPEILLGLDTIQQAKLQVIIPYVAYDLVFVYLKSRGIDPKTHRVVAELERVREYFDKIKRAEEAGQKRKLGVDRAAADRFIKHAIAQTKNAQLVDEPSDPTPVASSSSNRERVPVKVTGKMMARAEYQRELEKLGNEEEEDLEVFDEEAGDENEGAMDAGGPPEDIESPRLDKGKGRALDEVRSSRRKRPPVDHSSGLSISESAPQTTTISKKARLSKQIQSISANGSSRGVSVSTSEDRDTGKAAKRKAKKS